jgi:hypothetical protein
MDEFNPVDVDTVEMDSIEMNQAALQRIDRGLRAIARTHLIKHR